MTMATSITVRVPLAIRRRPGRKTVVTPVYRDDAATVPTRADPALAKALAWAFRYLGAGSGELGGAARRSQPEVWVLVGPEVGVNNPLAWAT